MFVENGGYTMNTYKTNPESFIEKANILKALAHPVRLCIVKTLCENEYSNVTDMQSCLGEAQSTISQHVSRLRAANIITGRREGTKIYYSIANERVRKLLEVLMRS